MHPKDTDTTCVNMWPAGTPARILHGLSRNSGTDG